MSFNVDDWLKEQNSENVIHSFVGVLSADLITKSLTEIESKLENLTDNPKIVKKAYNVIVECIQNLFHHSEIYSESENKERLSAFYLSKQGNNIYVHTGNYILDSRVKFLKDRIEQLNLMSHEEIKALYKMVLNNDEFSDKGGGGLGMIDIIKRTENKIEYSINKISDKFYFYIFGVKI